MPYELDREEFTAWVKAREDAGIEYIGRVCTPCQCPIAQYLQAKYELTFYVGVSQAGVSGAVHGPETVIHLDTWAREFVQIVDNQLAGPRVSPRACLDILERVPYAV